MVVERNCDMEYLRNESIYRDRYRILRKIGEGGSSVVYLAVDLQRNEPVAVKVLKENSYGRKKAGTDDKGGQAVKSLGRDARLMLSAEAENETLLLGSLHHPAIPGLVAAYEDAFVLEYVPGNSLEKVLKKKGRLSEKEAVAIGLELLEVLGYLHKSEGCGSHGDMSEQRVPVIYRDLKPANIMIRPDGHVSLIDFGAARLYSREGAVDTLNLGTYGFAAPEQFGSLGQTDPRTDIYCFGRTMLQMVGGKCSPELMQIIDKCTRPDREDRFENCEGIAKELRKYPGKRLMNMLMRNLRIAVAAFAVALVVSFGFAHYESVVSYAATDAETRIPAVKERLGYAGIRIKGLLEERGLWPVEGKTDSWGQDMDYLEVDHLTPTIGMPFENEDNSDIFDDTFERT